MANTMRNSNIELLRIVAMLMIVAHHFAVHSQFSFDPTTICINELWVQFIQIGGKIGVDIFVLISGYYLITSKSFKTSKVFKLWFQLLFYSILIFIIAIKVGAVGFSKKALLDACFPVSMSEWWFASTYFVLFLFSPFLNIFLKSMDKVLFRKFLVLALVLWCIFPSISGLYPKFTIIMPQFNYLLWFVTLYSVAAYIRLWHNEFCHSSGYYLLISFAALIGTFLSAVLFDYLNMIQQDLYFNPAALYDMTSITILIISVLALVGFTQLRLPYNRAINVIASAAFGVYLISDQSVIRQLLWITIFRDAEYANSELLIPYSIAVVLFVYLACTIIELIRIYLIEKHYMVVVNRISNKIEKRIGLLFEDNKNKA